MLNLKTMIAWFWRVYKFLCVFFVSFYIISLPTLWVIKNGKHKQLDSGIFVGRKHVFAGYNDIYLWHENGDLMVNKPIEFLCFGDGFISGGTWDNNPISLIYHIDSQKMAIQGSDEYKFIFKKLKKKDQNLCNKWVGTSLILDKPKEYWNN